MLRAIFPKAVFISKQKYVHAPVKFHSSTIHSKVDALIDSGATENFISPELAEHFLIPTLTSSPESFEMSMALQIKWAELLKLPY